MKKILFIFSVLIGTLSSCSENEIELYNEEVRLNFSKKNTACFIEFTDEDYLNKVNSKEGFFTVELQGDFLTSERTFCLTNKEREGFKSMAQVNLEKSYTFTALTESEQKYTIEIKRPEKPTDGIDNACGSLLVFDYTNPAHQFPEGRVDRSEITVTVTFNIKPRQWKPWSPYGAYSNNKYLFIMDTLGKKYTDIWYNENGELDQVKAAYKEYLKTHDPLLDDEGKPISFPEQ